MRLQFSLIGAAALLAATHASAVTIDFEDLAVGTILSNQYSALGVVFSPNALTGPGSSSSGEPWATDTDMTIVSAAGSDVGGLGTPALVGGNMLRSFAGWLGEDGDASFLMSFSVPVTSVSVTFAGVSDAADTRLLSSSGSMLAAGTAPGQFVLSYSSATPFSSIVVAPGNYNDWVGVDNIVFAPIPEPGTYALMALGVAGLLAWKRRQG